MSNIIGIEMSKEAAKKLIDESPGDTIRVFCVIKENGIRIHDKTEIQRKKDGKELIDQASGSISYDDLQLMGVLSMYEEWERKKIYRNIAFPQLGL